MPVSKGDVVFVVVKTKGDGCAITLAEVTEVCGGDPSFIRWNSKGIASNGEKVQCTYKTTKYFSSLEDAKKSLLQTLRIRKQKAMQKFDREIARIEAFECKE